MSWNYVLDGKGFGTKTGITPRQSDTYFSLNSNILSQKITNVLSEKNYFVNVDTEKNFIKEAQNLANLYGKYITKLKRSVLVRGKLEFVKSNISHPHFGENLDLFTISNPFFSKKPIFLYFHHNTQKSAGIFGEASIPELHTSKTGNFEGFCKHFFIENIETKIPYTIQDITDFDNVLNQKFNLQTSTDSINIGSSTKLTSVQKLWMPLVSGENPLGSVEGINSYSLINLDDSGSKNLEILKNLVERFNPKINLGKNKYSQVNFNLQKNENVNFLTDKNHRNIFKGKFMSGFRTNTGTVISRRNSEKTLNIIQEMRNSKNTDYTNVLEDLSIPTNLKSNLRSSNLFTGNFKFYLLSLKILPVKYNISDIKEIDSSSLRLAQTFAKLSPYLLDPKQEEVLVPQKLRDKYINGIRRFKKDNTNRTNDFIEDNRLLK